MLREVYTVGKNTVLQDAVLSAQAGDEGAFETFFILTNAETYYLVYSIIGDESTAMQLLAETYVSAFENMGELPLEEDGIYEKLEKFVHQTVKLQRGMEEKDLSEFHIERGIKKRIPDEKVATIWLQIEERTGNMKEQKEEAEKASDYVISGFRIVFMLLLVAAAGGVLFFGWKSVEKSREERKSQKILESQMETMPEATQPLIHINEELPEPGWEVDRDGSIYYIKRDQTQAKGSIALGRQIFMFDKNGILTSISDNTSITDKNGVTLYEDVRYEITEGDLYRKDAESGEKTCIIRNGHIVWVDIRDQSLYYVCEFQIPNSKKIKRSIYSASLDGTREKLLDETMEEVNTQGMQITDQWIYGVLEGRLIRKKLSGEFAELIADPVSNYFVLDDKNIYYMQEGQIHLATSGIEFVEGSMKYHVAEEDGEYVLKDSLNNPVRGDNNGQIRIGDRIYKLESGKIQYVQAAERRYGDLAFYISENTNDRKIYWKRDSGTIGLLRQSGKWADSFCIAGPWLYYSAYMGTDLDGNPTSQIFRVDLDAGQEEAVTGLFKGNVGNLYYFEDSKEIYGEYTPDSIKSMKGQIIVIPLGGSMSLISDRDVRPESTISGNDMFEIVSVENGNVLCYWHDCEWDKDTNELSSKTKKPVKLNSNDRTTITSFEGE